MSLIPFIVLELLMKNARHSNPVNRGGNDQVSNSFRFADFSSLLRCEIFKSSIYFNIG